MCGIMNNNNTNYDIDEELIGKPYTGPTKLVWENGIQIRKPDLDQSPPPSNHQFTYQKTLDDIISETDEIQFSNLKTDEEKYDMITGMITGVNERQTDPPFKVSESSYVDGEYRSLKTILRDLIDKRKVWLDPKDGNLYEYGYALQQKMIKFPCMYCSKVLYSEEERTKHAFSHMQQQQQE
jgi:hypothetical protein